MSVLDDSHSECHILLIWVSLALGVGQVGGGCLG